MTKWFYLIPLVWAANSHAVLKIGCTLEGSGEQTRVEFQDQAVNFTPLGNEFQSNHDFEFKMLPGYVSSVQLVETSNLTSEYSAKVYWNSVIVTRRRSDNTVVARGFDHQFKVGDRYFKLFCDGYDQTQNLDPLALSDYEKHRYDWVGGPGHKREYVNVKLQELDHWDLWRQLIAHNSEEGRLLVETVKQLQARGFRPVTLHTYEDYVWRGEFKTLGEKVNCTSGRSRFTCDVESFSLGRTYLGKIRRDNLPEEDFFGHLTVTGKIFRESESRNIRGYQILGVSFHVRRFGGGGGSSTSGGRIGNPN